MIGRRMVLYLALLGCGSAFSQIAIPGNPGKFKTRDVGGASGSTGAVIRPSPATRRYVTYFVLADTRLWTSSEGKPLSGKLIAFENGVVEATADGAEPGAPTPPAHPTVVSAAKVRLLVEGKPVELALARLSEPDQAFVESIRVTHAVAAP